MRFSLLALALASGALVVSACSEEVVSPSGDAVSSTPIATTVAASTPKAELGRELFFDMSLSRNGNQSCAACHDPKFGFTGP